MPELVVLGGMDGAQDGLVQSDGVREDEGGFKLKFCTVCARNQNRSVMLYICRQCPPMDTLSDRLRTDGDYVILCAERRRDFLNGDNISPLP